MPSATTKQWKVYRFEKPDGTYAEVASNEVGPNAIPLPKGYRFVRSTPLVLETDAEKLREAGKRLMREAAEQMNRAERYRVALTALYEDVQMAESVGICLPDRVSCLRAGDLLAGIPEQEDYPHA